MCLLVKKLWHDEAGVVITAELCLILTIVVLGVVVGLVHVRNSVVAELHDVSLAMSHLNQSYGFSGYSGTWKPWCGWMSWTAGSSFIDLYEGGSLTSGGDLGFGGGGAAFYDGGAFAGGGHYGAGHGGFAYGRMGTIVLADGTLIPISLAAHGTWSLPGGALLVEYASHAGLLVLADGTMISYLAGGPGVVELAGGIMIAARPGVAGTLVLSDGRIATFSATDAQTVILSDGTAGRFFAADLDHVILANGTTVAVVSGAVGTLVLLDGRVLQLHDAVSAFSGQAATAGTIVLADGTLIPIIRIGAGRWALAGGTVLAQSASQAGMLVLANGSTIPFVIGMSGIVELAGGQMLAARPGAVGTVVLPDGRLATFSATNAQSVTLADGTVASFHAVAVDHVILSNGTTVLVKTGEAGTLVLPDGRVLQLSEAVLLEGASQVQPIPELPAPTNGVVLPPGPALGIPHDAVILQGGAYPPAHHAPGAPVPSHCAPCPSLVPQYLPQPGHGGGLPTYRRYTPGRGMRIEIPAGPIPQSLPQV